MRRRDASNFLLRFRPTVRRRTALSFAVSLGLHAGLLAILSLVAVRVAAPARLIMVSLIAGGGRAGTPSAAPMVPAGAETSPPQRQTQAARPRRRRAIKASAPVVAAAPTPRVDTQLPSPVGAGGAGVASAGAGDGGLGGTGGGTGSGHGDGSGAGDQRARCVVCPEPTYPLVARRHGWQGTVEVGVSLLADGSVAAADVRRSCGYEVLDREAIAVARRSRFTPLGVGPVRGHIAYRFELVPRRP
jgi:periplasmic protein TonB